MQHVKNALQNTLTEWTPHSVQRNQKNKLAHGVEYGDDAVLVVGDGEVSVGECADAGGALQLPRRAASGAELEPEFSVGAEALHALVVRVGHDYPA